MLRNTKIKGTPQGSALAKLGYSPRAKILAPFARKASCPIFGWSMRTHFLPKRQETGLEAAVTQSKEKTGHEGRFFLLYKGYEKDIFQGLQ